MSGEPRGHARHGDERPRAPAQHLGLRPGARLVAWLSAASRTRMLLLEPSALVRISGPVRPAAISALIVSLPARWSMTSLADRVVPGHHDLAALVGEVGVYPRH